MLITITFLMNRAVTTSICRRAALATGLLLLPHTGAGQSRLSRSDWQVHRDNAGGYYLSAPPAWRSVEPRNPGERMLLFAPSMRNAGRPGLANFNVIINEDPSTARLTQAQIETSIVRPLSINEWRQLLGNLRFHSISENRMARVNGRIAQAVVYSYRYESFTSKHEIISQLVLVQRPGRLYFFGLNIGADTRQEADLSWRAWRAELEAVLDGLVFTT